MIAGYRVPDECEHPACNGQRPTVYVVDENTAYFFCDVHAASRQIQVRAT